MALEGRAGIAQFDDAKLRDPQILQFIKRIRVEHEPKFEEGGGRYRIACRLVVRTTDGRDYETLVPYRKGSPEDPMTADELLEKFRELAANLDKGKSTRIADLVAHLEQVTDLSSLSGLLASG
jgi:2-methylcitrate dehydratase PrpD